MFEYKIDTKRLIIDGCDVKASLFFVHVPDMVVYEAKNRKQDVPVNLKLLSIEKIYTHVEEKHIKKFFKRSQYEKIATFTS